ncbi:hypothetical protein K1W54_35330, partial [Micromonospora sp. CPCC 205371]|nr:hypothetical protein [Micromonospora sp. CPCC 205371]
AAAATAAGGRIGAATLVVPAAAPFRHRLGLAADEGHLILVRPDGHTGYVGALDEAPQAAEHLRAHVG